MSADIHTYTHILRYTLNIRMQKQNKTKITVQIFYVNDKSQLQIFMFIMLEAVKVFNWNPLRTKL